MDDADEPIVMYWCLRQSLRALAHAPRRIPHARNCCHSAFTDGSGRRDGVKMIEGLEEQ